METIVKKLEFFLSDTGARFSCSDVMNFIDKNDEFVIFGAGQGGVILQQKLLLKNKNTVCFLDNDIKKNGNSIAERSVYHPSKFDFENKKILIASTWSAEIARQLADDFALKPMRDFVPLYSFFCDGDTFAGGMQAIGEPFHDYVLTHEAEFSRVFEILSDDRSRAILEKVIKFRCNALQPNEIGMDDFPHHAPNFKKYFENIADSSAKLCQQISDPDQRYAISQTLLTSPYSYSDLVSPANKNVIIDAGAFDGDTAGMFAVLSPTSRIYSFEPVGFLYARLLDLSKELSAIQPRRKALWHSSGEIQFKENSLTPNMSTISNGGAGFSVGATSLDDFVKNEKLAQIDFIKMDIEGAELDALKGSENSIKKFQPDLAICLYHRPEHLWQIPLWVKQTLPDYKIYIDHKSQGMTDTICFATVS